MAEKSFAWTRDQDRALRAGRENLLISAAAGSGKTAVLTERIYSLLTDPDHPIPLSDIVAITYTRAAAASLREKLKERLLRAAGEEPDNRTIHRILLSLPYANISTVHAFCLKIIRENASLLSLPTHLSPVSDAQKDRLQKECMTRTLELFFSERSPLDAEHRDTLTDLYYLFLQGRNKELHLLPIKIYEKLRALEEGVEKLSDLTAQSRADLRARKAGESDFFATFAGTLAHRQLSETCASLSKKLQTYLDAFPSDELADETMFPHARACQQTLARAAECLDAQNYAEFSYTLTSHVHIKYQNRSRVIPTSSEEGKELKAFYDTKIKKPFDEMREYYCEKESRLIAQEERRILLQETLYFILRHFDSLYREKKRSLGLLDYADLEHYGLEALRKSGTTYCRALFVDEYQDTNRLQDIFFRECVKKDGFFFFVGDVKQSIYRFRNAAPELFLSYKNNFPDYTLDKKGEATLGKSIFFSDNFRSDSSVIDFANDAFSVLMNDNRRASDRMYSEKDALRKQKGSDAGRAVEYYLLEESSDPLLREADQDECALITERVLSLIHEEGKAPEDIAVIARSNAFLSKLRRAMKKAEIPVSSGNTDLLDTVEAEEFIALLSALDNPLDDISLVSLCTGSLFSFSSEELVSVRNYCDGPFYQALEAAAGSENLSPVGDKARTVLSFLQERHTEAARTPLATFLLHLLYEDGMLTAISRGDRQKKETLLKLYREACGLEQNGRCTVSDFLSYLADRKAQVLPGESDAQQVPGFVTLMTVHKSKGLEFDTCIFAQLGHEQKKDSELFFDPACGIYSRSYDEKKHFFYPTLAEKVMRKQYEEESLEESKRLLYVGITRAKEKLILIDGKKTSIKKRFCDAGLYPYLEDDAIHSHELNSLSSMLLYSLRRDPALREFAACYTEEEGARQSVQAKTFRLTVVNSATLRSPRDALKKVQKTGEQPAVFAKRDLETVRAALCAHARRKNASLLPSKLSVSEILHLSAKDHPELKTHLSFEKEERLGAAHGTAMHTFMQFCSFEAAKENVQREAARLCDLAFLTEEEAQGLNFYALSRFFSSPLFARIEKSPRVKRELRFNVFLPSRDVLRREEDGEILVQGVIDCFYEKEDGTYAILDFKTDAVSPDTGEELLKRRHGRQLQLYRLALEKMSGVKVTTLSLYSFSLAREITLPSE